MADSTEDAWWAARGEPRNARPGEAAPTPQRSPSRRVLLAALLAAAALTAAFLSGAFGSTPASSLPGAGLTGTPGGGIGAQARGAFLASCQGSGTSAAYCGCVFSQLSARRAYATPNALSALTAELARARRENETSSLPLVVTQALAACSEPAASAGSSAKHAI